MLDSFVVKSDVKTYRLFISTIAKILQYFYDIAFGSILSLIRIQ